MILSRSCWLHDVQLVRSSAQSYKIVTFYKLFWLSVTDYNNYLSCYLLWLMQSIVEFFIYYFLCIVSDKVLINVCYTGGRVLFHVAYSLLEQICSNYAI